MVSFLFMLQLLGLAAFKKQPAPFFLFGAFWQNFLFKTSYLTPAAFYKMSNSNGIDFGAQRIITHILDRIKTIWPINIALGSSNCGRDIDLRYNILKSIQCTLYLRRCQHDFVSYSAGFCLRVLMFHFRRSLFFYLVLGNSSKVNRCTRDMFTRLLSSIFARIERSRRVRLDFLLFVEFQPECLELALRIHVVTSAFLSGRIAVSQA